jgi:hypothetical protein
VDQPAVISAFRSRLPELDARPDIKTIAVKFGEELWWQRLLASGFDPSAPSLFLVEGLVMYLGETEVEEIFREIHRLMAPGSVVMGDYVNKGFLHHPMVQPFNDQLQSYSAPWTYGVRNSMVWAGMLSGCGLAVQEDMPSVELHSLSTRVKFYLIDKIGTWVPTYRTYVAVKEAASQDGGEVALVGGQSWQGRKVFGRSQSLLAFALSLALFAANRTSSMWNAARLTAASVAMLLAAARSIRGARTFSCQ